MVQNNIFQLFEDACQKFSDHQCVRYVTETGSTTYTYSNIRQHVKKFHNSLRQWSLSAQAFIAVVGNELTPDVIVIINGILQSNNAFVFLDISNASTIIFDIITELSVSCFVGPKNLMDQFSNRLPNLSLNLVTVVPIFSNEFEIWKLRKRKGNIMSDLNLAFAVFSSGSTSDTPKLIKVPHSCILPNIFDLRRIYQLQSADTLFISTPMTFDPCILDIFLAFSSGACILCANHILKYEPSYVLKYFSAEFYNTTVMYTTPSLFLKWFPRHVDNISLRILTLGGEPFPNLNLESWPFLKNTQVFNIYGITEVSCWATICRVLNFENVSLGSPLTDTLLEVRNNDNCVIRDGIGELYIGSECRRCFLNNEIDVGCSSCLYRPTGDLVKIINDQYYYVGREDRRIKIYGHQVDLLFIEDRISRHPSVKCCYCIFMEKENKLVTLVELNHDLSEENLIKFLMAEVPSHMIPTDIHFVSQIPLNEHGKISKKDCKALYLNSKQNKDPRTEFQKRWIKYTRNNDFNKEHGFLQSGGNSMLALQFSSTLEFISEKPNNFLAYLLSDKSYIECQNLWCSALLKTPFQDHVNASESSKSLLLVPTNNDKNSLNLDSHEELVSNYEFGSPFHVLCKGLTLNIQQQEYCNKLMRIEEPRIKWKHDLEKCVDASPTLLSFNAKIIAVCGSHSGLLAIVDVESGLLLSKIKLPNRIESSACVSLTGDLVFVGCYDGNMYCIDIIKCSIKWRFQTQDIIKSTAVYYNNKIYFGSYDHNFYCLFGKNGRLLWRKKLDNFPIYAKAVVTKEIILVATLGGHIVFMQHDSVLKNEISYGNPFFCNPVELPNSSLCAIVDVTGILRLLDLISYSEVWSYRIEGNVFSSISVSYITNPKIYFGCHDRNVYCFEIIGKIGHLVWKTELDDSVYSTPFFNRNLNEFCGDFVVAVSVSGSIFILDASKGNVFMTHSIKRPIFSSPVVFESNIIVGCRNNFLYCLTT